MTRENYLSQSYIYRVPHGCKGKCSDIKIQRFIGSKVAELLYNGFVGCTTCDIIFDKIYVVSKSKNRCPCCKTPVRFKTRENKTRTRKTLLSKVINS